MHNSHESIVETFMQGVQQKSIDAISILLDSTVSLVQPMTFSGSSTPEVQFEGKNAVIGYLQNVFAHMALIRFANQKLSIANDENVVFLEAIGDFMTFNNAPYRNVYIFKFELKDSKITRIAEYANPVTYAITFGVKLG